MGDADRAKHEIKEGTDLAPAKQSAAKRGDEEDRIGLLGKSESGLGTASGRESSEGAEHQGVRDSVDWVTQSFHWFSDAARDKLETLRTDLKKEDEPSWVDKLAMGVLELGLGTGAVAAGKYLAGKLSKEEGTATKDLLEHVFSDGIDAGVKAGVAKLSGGKDEHVIDPFVDAQKEGVWAIQMANQRNWIKNERKKVRTAAEAEKLEEACSRDNVKAAAEKQYQASRDAWVSYLAQARFGAIGKHGPVTKDSVNTGPTRTDMSTQAQRDRDAKGTIGYREATDAPDYADAARGDAPGVLEVVAHLPRISPAVPGADVTNVMDAQPQVTIAILNGVNDAIRAQYAGTALADMRIPRQVTAKVEGAPDFTLNIDEQGNTNGMRKAQSTWLRQRATVGHPENAALSDFEKEIKGRELLLKDLVPGAIFKRGV